MTKMRKWLDLYESYESSLYENFQSNVPGEFEESGWIYIEDIEWIEMMEHEGLMKVQFAATHYNKEWTEAAKRLKSQANLNRYGGMRVPPFIDEDQLWMAISNFLEAEGYKYLGAQFDVYGGSWNGDSLTISVSNDIVAQGKALQMKKRFKKESIDEAMEDAFLDEDAFFIQAVPYEYQVVNPMVYGEWLSRYNHSLQKYFEVDSTRNLAAGKKILLEDMNRSLKIMKSKVKIIDLAYDFDIFVGLYKIKYIPPKNFRHK